jgi:hypothetical protein
MSEPPEPPRWWDEVAHFLVLHKSISFSGVRETDPDDKEDNGTVAFDKGEEIPPELVTPTVYDAFGDRIAALDGAGERLDKTTYAERNGDIESESVLSSWRSENNLSRRTVEVFECGECGKTFETLDALNGHQSAHVERAEDVEASTEFEGEGTREDVDPDYDPEEGGESA